MIVAAFTKIYVEPIMATYPFIFSNLYRKTESIKGSRQEFRPAHSPSGYPFGVTLAMCVQLCVPGGTDPVSYMRRKRAGKEKQHHGESKQVHGFIELGRSS